MRTEKIIKYDSDEAAVYKTGLSGWVSSGGSFFGKDEHMARYAGCTHRKCSECDNYTRKTWLLCDDCRSKKSMETYNSLPYAEWDGVAPICLWSGDRYFFNEGELIDYLYDNELNGTDVSLVFCAPIEYTEVGYGYWGDDAHEDWEPPKKLEEAVEALNAVIRELPPHSYMAGKIRTSYNYEYKSDENIN